MLRKGVFLLAFILVQLQAQAEVLPSRSVSELLNSRPGLLEERASSQFLLFQKEFLRPEIKGQGQNSSGEGENGNARSKTEPVFAVDYDLLLRYTVINPGPFPVSGVRVEDGDFAAGNPFRVKVPEGPHEGDRGRPRVEDWGLTFDIGTVKAGEKITVDVELRPWKEEKALLKLNPAKLWFTVMENGDFEEEDEIVGFSSLSHERIRIMSKRAADRHKTKIVDLIFGLFFLIVPIIIPMILWLQSHQKYEALDTEWKELRAQWKLAKKAVKKKLRKRYSCSGLFPSK